MKISKKLRTLLIALGVVTSAGAWVYTLMHAHLQPKPETQTSTSTNEQPENLVITPVSWSPQVGCQGGWGPDCE